MELEMQQNRAEETGADLVRDTMQACQESHAGLRRGKAGRGKQNCEEQI